MTDLFIAITQAETALADIRALANAQLADQAALQARFDDLQARYDALINPPPPPPDPTPDPPPDPTPDPVPVPDNDTIHIGAPLRTSVTRIGWTSTQNQDHTTKTAAILRDCGHINNHHIISFGAPGPMQTAEGGPIDFRYLDTIFGQPGKPGYFPSDREMCVTFYGCPVYMRTPKAGTAPNPMGNATLGTYDLAFPHWSHFDNFAKLCEAVVRRYPQIKYGQIWQEDKGAYIGSRATGSVIVPPGSGLPQAPGSDSGRPWSEGVTALCNAVWDRVKAARPDFKIAAPYTVCRTYADPNNSSSADAAFPMNLHGPWGYADMKQMRHVMYFAANCHGADYLCLDVKTSTNDTGISEANQWDGLAKVPAWINWLRQVGASDAKYRRPQCDLTKINVWFAEAYSRIKEYPTLTPALHAKAVAVDAWSMLKHVIPYDVACWMRWQPEGQGTDPAQAHSISLWENSTLKPTEAVTMYKGLVANFPPGTALLEVTTGNPDITGLATPSKVCLASRATTAKQITFLGHTIELPAYGVALLDRA